MFDPELDLPPEKPDASKHIVHMAGLILLFAPVVAFGILLCATIVWAPLGIVFIWLGSRPAYRCNKKYSDRLHEWNERDRPLFDDDEMPPPWSLN